jgi:hypothetical protein
MTYDCSLNFTIIQFLNLKKLYKIIKGEEERLNYLFSKSWNLRFFELLDEFS